MREVIESCRRVTGHAIPTQDGPRRAGDPPALYADSARIQTELGWTAEYTDLDAIVETVWRWRKSHPTGYEA